MHVINNTQKAEEINRVFILFCYTHPAGLNKELAAFSLQALALHSYSFPCVSQYLSKIQT